MTTSDAIYARYTEAVKLNRRMARLAMTRNARRITQASVAMPVKTLAVAVYNRFAHWLCRN